MSTRAPIVDGLWLCFRPSFGRLFSRPSRFSSPLNNGTTRNKRAYSSSTEYPSTRFSHPPGKNVPSDIWAGDAERNTNTASNSASHDYSQIETTLPANIEKNNSNAFKKKRWPKKKPRPKELPNTKVLLKKRGAPKNLRNKSDTKLENFLQSVVERHPNHSAALRVVRELVEHRNIEPKPRHYKAMVLANVDNLRGSAIQVKMLLEEMDKSDIVLDSGTLHAAIRSLAVHPDYILRQQVLHDLRDRWLPLSPAGWHDVVTGLIRERQYEMALETMERMELQHIPIEDWLFALLLYNLADAGEFDEVLQLMRTRIEAGHKLSPNLWFHLLDGASAALHERLTGYIWKQQVQLGYINPTYGVCNNALAICSRTGNTELAISVFKILGDRKAVFKVSDFEALIDTYVTANNMDSALRILCTMNKANVGAHESSTRSILSHWMVEGTVPQDAWATLKRLRNEEKLDVPLAAANVIIELCAHKSQADTSMDIYRELHTVCSTGAETATFNLLIHTCRKTGRYDLGAFFIQEMILLKALPDRTTYENLVLFCIDNGRYKEAYSYLLEMRNSGFALAEKTKEYIRVQCSSLDDKYAQYLKYDSAVRTPISRGLKRLSW